MDQYNSPCDGGAQQGPQTINNLKMHANTDTGAAVVPVRGPRDNMSIHQPIANEHRE